MNIVAHQDDDFLFMNPDLQNQISAGQSLVTVYLTAGEAGGNGRCSNVEGSRAEHAGLRQRAVRAAYAQMANASWTPAQADNASWTRELIVPDLGVSWPHTVERYTLASAPNIQLVFMNLREAGDDSGPSIGDLFDNHLLVANTVVPSCGAAGSCVRSPSCNPDVPQQNYSHDEIVAVLSGLVTMYQPTILRTLDPLPLEIAGNHENLCRSPGYFQDVCFDNLDHRYAARYADEVATAYHGPNGTGRSTLVHYKGYSHTNYPNNVGNASYTQKRAGGEAYRQAKVPPTANCPAPCLDDIYYYPEVYEADYQSMYERFPGGTTWLQRANNTRLVAVAVQDRQVKMWSENAVGGSWTGPVSLGGGAPMAPNVTLLVRPDGRLQIFATRLPLGMAHTPPVAPYQEVITAIQVGTTMTFGSWQSVGAPDTDASTGVATAAIDGSGRVFVFARNSSGRVAYTYATGATWASWAPLVSGASDVMDGFAAVTRDDGVIEVFATARSGAIQRYVQSGTSATFTLSSSPVFSFGNAAGPPTVAKNQDGRLQIFYREATSIAVGSPAYGRVLTAWVSPAGTWTGPAVLFGDAGVGPVAAIRRGGTGEIEVFERNTWNGLSLTRQQAPNAAFLTQWNLRGGLLEEYPAAATDNAGRVVVVIKGSDGKLYYQREASAAAIGAFGAWTAAGS